MRVMKVVRVWRMGRGGRSDECSGVSDGSARPPTGVRVYLICTRGFLLGNGGGKGEESDESNEGVRVVAGGGI